ncbi:TMEM175 family protein [Acetobacteraceae bacterium KSS8]|uniref:TMEM175 family protein n=1 Tax=Endosaccharibacter trunci TaxID=2812733 RepID=A0ABT1W6M0_9PROT|nr:TMEM175 family protein [Acetobacteraceae bacterium KSS8]
MTAESRIDSERLVAFSDGVIAVIITIMVLELKAPAGAALADVLHLWPVLLAYVLSFIYVGIYWTNHHHFARLMPHVTGGILWANLHLLFWLSLVPFTTAWVGDHESASVPTALYGLVLMGCALSWLLLQRMAIRAQGPNSPLKRALGRDWKGKLSFALYLAGIAASFLATPVADLCYAIVAALWLVPDRRVERHLRGTAV